MAELSKRYDPKAVEPKWYQHWLENGDFVGPDTRIKGAGQGSQANVILGVRPEDMEIVAEKDGAAAGYVTCHGKPGEADGSIGLVGVGAAFRGAGVASGLVAAAQAWFRDVPLAGAIVVTQGRNVEAQKVYERAGFRAHRVQLWYHLWL